jgi:hypothetical protein
MKITPVDDTNRLFSIEEIAPPELVAEILATNWAEVPWKRGNAQEHWSRRELIVDDYPALQKYHNCVYAIKEQIEKLANIKFINHPFTMWWYDEPGFTVSIHTDGHLPSSLQVFWRADSEDFGTEFYEYKDESALKHKFKFIPNNGYSMLNGLDPDGSQPLQWHGMSTTVQTYRICSYTQFGPYELVK